MPAQASAAYAASSLFRYVWASSASSSLYSPSPPSAPPAPTGGTSGGGGGGSGRASRSHVVHLRSRGSVGPRACARALALRASPSVRRWRRKGGRGSRSGRLRRRYCSVFSRLHWYVLMKYSAAQKAAREVPSTEWMSTDSPTSSASSMNSKISSRMAVSRSRSRMVPRPSSSQKKVRYNGAPGRPPSQWLGTSWPAQLITRVTWLAWKNSRSAADSASPRNTPSFSLAAMGGR